jgi:iron complex outermembrane receptor protein
MYFDYGIASTTTIGRYNAYPQPGRTVMARFGLTWP